MVVLFVEIWYNYLTMITIYKTNSMKSAAKFVVEDMKRVDKRNLSLTRTVIVPDRVSLEAERALLGAVGGSFNIQVKTFRRLAADVLPKYDYLSKQAGVMALAMIVKDNKEKLTCYVKGVETAGFIEDMYDVISMMKYCKIKPQDLLKAELPKSVAGKARDVATLYQAYCDYTEGRFIDSADKLDLLCETLTTTNFAENGYYYFYDFDNFTAQELAIIEQLALKSRGVTVACCASDRGKDAHLYLNDIYEGVLAICKRNRLTPNIKTEIHYEHQYAKQIGEHLYRYDAEEAIPADNFAEVFEGSTRVNEVYALACKIQQYVRADKSHRFKDVYVVTSDVAKYSNAISTVFSQFDIPYFCDRQFALADHPYARFVVDYLTLCRNNGKLPFVLSFVKNYLFCGNFDGKTSEDDVFLFENYCLKYNVNYRKANDRYEKFNLGKDDEPNFARIDAFRKKFNALYASNKIRERATVNEYVESIRKLLEYAQLAEKNAKFAEKQAENRLEFESKVTSQAQEKLEGVLQQACNVMGERRVELDEFIKLLTAGIASVKISVIPVFSDCVVFANMAKARKHDIKFLALLGANQGAMPIVKNDCKLLSDRNIKDLVSAGVNVEPLIFTENKRERFSLFQLLLEPTKKLYVSYTTTDGANGLLPSSFIAEFEDLFTVRGKTYKMIDDKHGKYVTANVPLQPNRVADEDVYTEKQAVEKVILNDRRAKDKQIVTMPAYAYLRKKYADEVERYAFDKDGKAVRVERGGELYLKGDRTSVSQLTSFFKCPYQFFFHYGLNVKPRPVAELKSADLGVILHAVMENYVKNMKADESDADTSQKAEKCFEDALQSDVYKGMESNAKMKGVLRELRREAARMCIVIKEQLRDSNFENLATEMKFGEGKCKPVVVKFDGGSFNLNGVVDRVDVRKAKKDESGNEIAEVEVPFIVIDYKSGEAAADYNERYLYIGQKLQLLLYVKAVMDNVKPKNEKGRMRPVGFYYFNMHDDFADLGEATVYTYTGRTLFDLGMMFDIDTKFEKEKFSEKLALRLTKDGAVNGNQEGKLLTDEQIENQIEYALRLIARAGELMHNEGYAAINPYKGACKYCDYRSICDYDDVYTYEAREVNGELNKNTIDKTVQNAGDGAEAK